MSEYRKIPHPKWVTYLFFAWLIGGSILAGVAFGLAMQAGN